VDEVVERQPSRRSPASGPRLFARILGNVVAYEGEHKARRQRLGNAQRAKAGLPLMSGHRPFGYDDDRVTVRAEEAALVKEGYRQLLAGSSLRAIAADWNSAGLTSSRGRPWRPDSVRYLLNNPRYAGRRSYHGDDLAEGTWPAVVDVTTWQSAVALLSDPGRRTMPGNSRKFLLSGLSVCHCGAKVSTGRTQSGTRTYQCSRLSTSVDPPSPWTTTSATSSSRVSRSRPPRLQPGSVEFLEAAEAARAEAWAIRSARERAIPLAAVAETYGPPTISRTMARFPASDPGAHR
jgi:hypothetical protein